MKMDTQGTIEISRAENGFIVRSPSNGITASSDSDTVVFNEFELMVKWLHEHFPPKP